MNWYRNLRIAVKLQLAFAVIMVIIIGTGVLIRGKVQNVGDISSRILNHNVPTQYFATEALANLNEANTHIAHYKANGSDQEKQTGVNCLTTTIQSLESCYNAAIIEANKKAAQHIQETVQHYKNILAEMGRSTSSLSEAEEEKRWSEITTLQNSAEAELKEVCKRANNAMGKGKEEMVATMETTQVSLIYIIASVIVLCIILSWLVSSIISRPIISLNNIASQVAQRNFSVRSDIQSRDEIGAFARTFNDMMDNLEDSIEEATAAQKSAEESAYNAEMARLKTEAHDNHLSQSVATIVQSMNQFAQGDLSVCLPVTGNDAIAQLYNGFNQSVDNIRLIISKVKEAIEAAASSGAQISAGTEQMSVGAREQSNQVSEVAAAMEEMSRTVDDNAQLAGRTSHIAQSSRQTALEGGKVIEESIAKVKDIANSVEIVGATVEHLGERSKEIGQIVNTIKEIASQTNLLALNAAIEAARAGEQGRGFAVVADEVRKLAERTQSSTKEIETKIGAIQSETMQAVEMMGKSMTLVQEGIALSDGAGQSLTSIVRSVEQVVETVDMIAKANSEQAIVGTTVARNVENILNVSQEMAKGLGDVANATTNLSQMTQNLQVLASQFHWETTVQKNNATLVHKGTYRNAKHSENMA